jgi:hypothetical protein
MSRIKPVFGSTPRARAHGEQAKVLNRLLDGGESGFEVGISAAQYPQAALHWSHARLVTAAAAVIEPHQPQATLEAPAPVSSVLPRSFATYWLVAVPFVTWAENYQR